MNESNIPQRPSLETFNHVASKASVCLVNGGYQGVLQLNNVLSIDQKDEFLIVYGEGKTKIAMYDVRDIWGAWLDWPVKFFRTKSGMQRMGPRYFLEMVWKEWEWLDDKGVWLHRFTNTPSGFSIWCDDTNTDKNPMMADVELEYGKKINIGWVRKDRILKQKRVNSFKYPLMP